MCVCVCVCVCVHMSLFLFNAETLSLEDKSLNIPYAQEEATRWADHSYSSDTDTERDGAKQQHRAPNSEDKRSPQMPQADSLSAGAKGSDEALSLGKHVLAHLG